MPVEMLFLNCSLPLIIMSIHPNATGSEATGRLPFNSKDAYIVLFAVRNASVCYGCIN